MMTCVKLMAEAGDARRADLVRMAYQILQTRAEKIPDPDVRRRFVESVPWHLELLAHYEKLYLP
jgi:hypothetical protein